MTASDQPAPPDSLSPSPSFPVGARFCTTCGAALSEQPRFCPSCGAPVGAATRGPGVLPVGPTVTLAGTQYQLATFWRRLGASLIDGVAWSTVTQVLTVRLQGPMFSFQPSTEAEFYDFLAELLPTVLSTMVLTGVLGAIVFIGFEAYGWTPGKAALGLRVLRSDGRRPGPVHGAARYGSKVLSAIVFYLGYLWMIWDRGRQTWHDKFASTYVVSIESAPTSEANTFGPLATSGGAWLWAVLTVIAILLLSAVTLAIAAALPRDGDGYRRFFEGLANEPRQRAELAPGPAHPVGNTPRIERIEHT